jgi:hypothetical protein
MYYVPVNANQILPHHRIRGFGSFDSSWEICFYRLRSSGRPYNDNHWYFQHSVLTQWKLLRRIFYRLQWSEIKSIVSLNIMKFNP